MKNWDRPTIKALAKDELRISYWGSLLVCLVGIFLTSTPTRDSLARQADGARLTITSMQSILMFLVPFALPAALLGLIYHLFVAYPVEVGMSRYFIRAPMGERRFGNLFWAFGSGCYPNIVITMLAYRLIVMVGLILFVIPGIIFYYKYKMVPYILAREPYMPTGDVLKKSGEMTNGEKIDMFVLDVSFVGWYILGALLLVVGVIFVPPYVNATYARLYGALELKVTGNDPYDLPYASGVHEGYPGGYEWGPEQQWGNPPSSGYNAGGYTPPPPPPYGKHTKGPYGDR